MFEKESDQNFALITGASSGIGEAFTRKLASQGYNLIIVARRKERLQLLAAELQEKYSIQVEVLPADLTKEEDLEIIEKRIMISNDISMLINNAGFNTRGDFVEVNINKSINMINLHIVASIRLIKSILPQMIERNNGVIINVSSTVADVPAPRRVMYAATKAFLNSFSRSLKSEMKKKNIKINIKAITPGFTNTGFFSTKEFNYRGISDEYLKYAKSPEEAVDDMLATLAKEEVIVIADPKTRKIHSLMINEGKSWEEAAKIVFTQDIKKKGLK